MAHDPGSSKPKRSRWAFALHNLVGHPLMEIAHLVGAHRVAQSIHSLTLPEDLRDAGRLMMEVEAGEYFGPQSGWLSQREIDAAMGIYWDRMGARMAPAEQVTPQGALDAQEREPTASEAPR